MFVLEEAEEVGLLALDTYDLAERKERHIENIVIIAKPITVFFKDMFLIMFALLLVD